MEMETEMEMVNANSLSTLTRNAVVLEAEVPGP